MDDIEYRLVKAVSDLDQTRRATLVLVPNSDDVRNPLVRLHLPFETDWSGRMLANDAYELITRERRLIPDPFVVEVVDEDNLWPDHWSPIIKD